MILFPITLTNIDERWAPEFLRPNDATTARRADIAANPGAVKRGKGQVRPNFTSGNASTIVACGFFERRDGTIALLYQTTAGAVEVSYGPDPNWLDADY